LIKEALIWKQLRHPNTVPFLGVIADDAHPFCYIVSPWMSNGHLTQYLAECPNADRLALINDIARGVDYLHSNNVVHGDLKGTNILIDDTGHACLSDFGISRMRIELSYATCSASVAGLTWTYAAPERVEPEAYGLEREHLLKESDIYSLSLVIWELFAGRKPFWGSCGSVIRQIMQGERPLRTKETARNGLSDEIWEIMTQSWQPDYKSRPPIGKILRRFQTILARSDSATKVPSDLYRLALLPIPCFRVFADLL
ncbi:kinase-like protein, partial [Wolfiporia cocos MD-104 SS10]